MAYSETPNSFPPIIADGAKILILGTMPGADSLRKQEYYGYKYNVFWKIIFELYEGEFTEDYQKRVTFAKENKVAIWDSLQYCERKGSLDSAIKNEEGNNFIQLFKDYPTINTIAFNGQKAAAYFKKFHGLSGDYTYYTMPSTSPANAATKYEQKLLQWSRILAK